MKRNLDTGVELCDNRVKKNQRHTTNGKPNMYLDIFNKFIKAVSDTVLDMINAAYHDKPLVFIRAIRLSLSRLFLTLC